MTEATQTIVERLLEPKAPLFYTDSTMRTIEVQRPLPIEREAAAEITRLQSELNTALERVKVLERVLTVALYALERVDGPIINHDGKIGLFLEKEANCSCSDAEREARAVLQSEGK